MNKIFQEIKTLNKETLFELLFQYDSYVIEVTNREDGSIPVYVSEFYQNEFQDILEQLKAQD